MKKTILILVAALGLTALSACEDLTRGCHEQINRDGTTILECR